MNIKILLFPLIALIGFSCARPLTLTYTAPEQMNRQYKSTTITNTTSKVMGMDVASNSTQEFTYTTKNKGNTVDGNQRIGLNYDHIMVSQSAMGNEVNYDSEGPTEDNDPNIAPIYDAMLNRPFELIYTEKGEIVEAPGLDKMLTAVFETLPEEARVMMESQMNEDVFLQMFQAGSNFYPSSPIKKGDQWTRTHELSFMGMTMDINTSYTLISSKDGQANIAVNGAIKTDPEAPGLEMAGMTMRYDLKGTQVGSMIVEEATGLATHIELEQNMSGAVNMDNSTTGPMEVEMILDTNIFIDQLSKE